MATEGAASVTRLPAGTPAIVGRHPALLVEWLQFVNWLSRWRQARGPAAVLAGGMVVVAGLLLAALSFHAAVLIERLARYWMLVVAVAAISSWTTVSRRRRHIEESQSQWWLIATPISPSSLRVSLAIRSLLPVVFSFVAATILSIAAALLAQVAAAELGTVIAALSAGVMFGCVAGWSLGSRGPKQTGAVGSRYVPHPRTQMKDGSEGRGLETQSRALKPDASALSRWPIVQVLSWSRPENSRYILIIALLAVQGGSSAIAGLSVVAMYFTASYLGALLSAMTTVARSAASWLRSTPMALGDFVWSVARRALVHQLAGTALAAIFMHLLGAPLAVTLQLAVLWLALVISISGCTLVDHHRGRTAVARRSKGVNVKAGEC